MEPASPAAIGKGVYQVCSNQIVPETLPQRKLARSVLGSPAHLYIGSGIPFLCIKAGSGCVFFLDMLHKEWMFAALGYGG